MTNRLERLALQRGVRVSGQRLTILQIINKAKDQQTAKGIHQLALELDRSMSLSTVYRALNILTAAGLLTRLELRGRRIRYEKAKSQHSECLVDLLTGRVLEFRSEGIEALLKHAVGQLGYRLLDYRLELFATPTSNPDGRTALSPDAEALPAPLASALRGLIDPDLSDNTAPRAVDLPRRRPHRRFRQ